MNSKIDSKEQIIEELQSIEHSLQNNLMQRQNFQVELNEIETALLEIKSSDGEVYKLTSGILIRSNPEKLSLELQDKKKLLQAKLSALENQSNSLEERANKLKKSLSI